MCWSGTAFYPFLFRKKPVSFPANYVFVPNFPYWFLFLVDNAKWSVCAKPAASCKLGASIWWVHHGVPGGSEAVLVFVWKWDWYTFLRVCVIVLSKYSGETRRDAAVLGQLLSVVGTSLSLVTLVGRSDVLRDTYIEFPGSGYREKLVEYPIFDLRLLRKCLRKFASVVFGSLDPFSRTEFIVRLKALSTEKGWHPDMLWDVLLCLVPLNAFSGGGRW